MSTNINNKVDFMSVIEGGICEINDNVEVMNSMVNNFNKSMKWCARFRKNGLDINPSEEFIGQLCGVLDNIQCFAEATYELIEKYQNGELTLEDLQEDIDCGNTDIGDTVGDSGPIEVEEEEETKPSICDAPNNPFKDEYVESDVNTSGGTNP